LGQLYWPILAGRRQLPRKYLLIFSRVLEDLVRALRRHLEKFAFEMAPRAKNYYYSNTLNVNFVALFT